MYFLKNKVFTYFLLILAIIVGGYMMNATPKELYPEIKIPVVVVSTVYPGASARDVEDSVTDILENGLIGGLKNVDEISSSSKEGVSVISVTFKDSVDINEALIDVQDRVDTKKSDLPSDATDPVISKVSFSDQPIYSFALSSTEAYNNLYKKSEDIKNVLLKIAGVSDVDVSGIPDREITVLLDPEKISQYKVSPQEVVRAISSSKQTFPAGSIVMNSREYRISYDSNVDTRQDLENIVVKTTASGNNIYIRDLVKIIEDGISIYQTQSRIGDLENKQAQQAVVFNVKKQAGGNIIDLTTTIAARLEKYQSDRPNEELNFVTIFDAGKEINTNLSDLISSGIQTVVLILLVMGFMVGIRESIIAAIAIPLSFLLAFIGMNFVGQTINFITLFSLILVIGILIDSAIVIVEGIYDFMTEGDSFDRAAQKTIKEFGKPVVAGVLTTISIFVPLMTLSGTLGQFIGGIPRVINIVLVMSLVVALVFIPAVAGILYKIQLPSSRKVLDKVELIVATFIDKWSNIVSAWRKTWKLYIMPVLLVPILFGVLLCLVRSVVMLASIPFLMLFDLVADLEKTVIEKTRNNFFKKITQWYRNFLTKLIKNSFHKKALVWGLIAALLIGFIFVDSGLIKSEFFPADEVDVAYINVELDQGTALGVTSASVAQVEEIVMEIPHVLSYTTTIGSENPFAGQMRKGSHYAGIVVNIDTKKNGPIATAEIRKAVKSINEFKVQVLVPESGPPVGAPFQVNIKGENWESINTAAEIVSEYVSAIPGTRDVESGVDVGLTEIKLDVLRDRLSEYNLTALDVSTLLRTSLYGTKAISLRSADDGDVDVVVKVALNTDAKTHRENNHISYDQIKNIPIQTVKGEVLLGYFVTERIEQATSVATHTDGKKKRTVTAYVNDGYLPAEIVSEFNKKIDTLDLPSDVKYSLAGASDENDKASSELLASLLLGVLLIFGVLIWQFGSVRDVFFIISVIPLGLIGVLWGLFLFNMTLSFTAMLGFIALVGVVVNNSIILVDVMNKIRVREPELSKSQVVIRGSTIRLRPILLTTITTVLGMVPLLFVSPMWKPFAASMIFGLSFATILTLVLIPIFYEKWSK